MTRVQKFEHRILTLLKIPVTTAFILLSLLGILSSEFSNICYSARTATPETSAAILARSLETSVTQSQRADTSETRSTRSPSAMVVGQRVYTSTDAARHSQGSGTSVYRCVRVGMGRPPSHTPGEWCLVDEGDKTPHQSIGNDGCTKRLDDLQETVDRYDSATHVRQRYRRVIPAKTGRHSISVSLPSSTGSAVTSTRCTDYYSGQAYPGEKNVLADLLSRRDKIIHTEWTLHQSVVNALCITWDRPNIDLFATRLNHWLPVFVSPMADPQAVDVDALSIA